ncbi:hypothetical protein ACFL0J_03535 [Candidatus Neomarinimicrobiota bacterium]
MFAKPVNLMLGVFIIFTISYSQYGINESTAESVNIENFTLNYYYGIEYSLLDFQN